MARVVAEKYVGGPAAVTQVAPLAPGRMVALLHDGTVWTVEQKFDPAEDGGEMRVSWIWRRVPIVPADRHGTRDIYILAADGMFKE